MLCEKPFAASPEEVATMYAAADEAGVMLQEGMWTRFFPATEHARTAMAEGAIGTVKTLQSTFPDRCYPIQAAPMVFGTDTYPVVAAAGSGEYGCIPNVLSRAECAACVIHLQRHCHNLVCTTQANLAVEPPWRIQTAVLRPFQCPEASLTRCLRCAGPRA